MKSVAVAGWLVALALGSALPALALTPRPDVIWARVSPGPITLDGVLNEPAWAQAESMIVRFGIDAGIPGSGWKIEAGTLPRDSTYATLKFLARGNQIYFAAVVKDSSVGGSKEFNRFDGFLMAIKDHADTTAPKPPAEYLYSWWYPELADPQPPGQLPRFIGRWAPPPPPFPGTPPPRDSTQIANWDAATTVQGQSNDDTVIDQGYTVEMRFNMTPMGYDITRPAGDFVEWNISIYDCDWFWPFNPAKFNTNRVWWQSPWGNAAWYNEVRIASRPDVTSSSGPVPMVEPDISIEGIAGLAPVLDGALTEAIWSDPDVYQFDIRWGDKTLRTTYPATGPYRAGQYQPEVYGGRADVLDPGDATVKVFTQGDNLYLGFDVRDQIVQYHPDFDRWDGFVVTLNDRVVRDGLDHVLKGRRLSFQVNAAGGAAPSDYLATLVSQGDAAVAIALKPGTTVDTLGLSADTGYTAELAVDLTSLGYASGLGDGLLFLGVNLLDGDSFLNPLAASYGTRTWWFRQYEGECCPVWAFLSAATSGVPAALEPGAPDYGLLTSLSNPSSQPTIRYALMEPSRVTIAFFDVTGRLVEERELGVQSFGTHEYLFDGRDRAPGLYFCRLSLRDPASGAARPPLVGRVVVLK